MATVTVRLPRLEPFAEGPAKLRLVAPVPLIGRGERRAALRSRTRRARPRSVSKTARSEMLAAPINRLG